MLSILVHGSALFKFIKEQVYSYLNSRDFEGIEQGARVCIVRPRIYRSRLFELDRLSDSSSAGSSVVLDGPWWDEAEGTEASEDSEDESSDYTEDDGEGFIWRGGWNGWREY